MKQYTLTDIEYSKRKKKTRREEFLDTMNRMIPWDHWIDLIKPYYPSGKRGRPTRGIETMLRMYLMQNWFNLSDAGLDIMASLTERFPGAKFVLTLGENGSVYFDGKEKVSQEIFKVEVVDTTAAGDTFTGYFLASVIAGKSMQDALKLAAKASSIAVSRPGAAPSIPSVDEVLV